MAEFEDVQGRTRRDPGETRRDVVVPPPREPLMRLPGVLAERFAVLGELPVQGAESDLLHVRDLHGWELQEGTEYVVKLYRRGYAGDREVWRTLPALESAHVVRILETGHADGRDYEVIEYHPAGNLRDLMRQAPDPQDVVAQLAEGLACLHRAGIVHRDLKPENVLVAEAVPLRLVITDFGLSKVIDQSVVFASSSRTLAYAAPESLSGQVSPARDWWSLGMIARELLTGRKPFEGMSETVVVDHLATRPVDNTDLDDPRLRLLCSGLLTRDPRRRWAYEEVTAWLQGQTPAVAESEELPQGGALPGQGGLGAGAGLAFKGRRFTDRRELARALVENWADGARYFFAKSESEAWRALRDWLGTQGDEGRIELIDWHLTAQLPPDVKLMYLVRWLDPDLPPHYLGRRVTIADLPGLAGLALDQGNPDQPTARRIGRDLWEHRLLPELGEEAVDARWRDGVTAWDRLAASLRGHVPAPAAARLAEAAAPGGEQVLLMLLALAARPADAANAFRQAFERARAQVPDPVPWFGWLVDGAGDDPLRRLAVVQTSPVAIAEAGVRERERSTQALQAAQREQHWQELESKRRAGTGSATVRAVVWSLPLLVLWAGGSVLITQLFGGSSGGTASVGAQQGAKGVGLGVLLALSVLVWLAECGCEVALARRQGGDYLPHGPWAGLSKLLGIGGRGLSKASQAVSGTRRSQGSRGCGFLLLAGLLPIVLLLVVFAALAAIVWLLWILLLFAAAAGHAIAAGLRLHRWKQAHELVRHEALA